MQSSICQRRETAVTFIRVHFQVHCRFIVSFALSRQQVEMRVLKGKWQILMIV